MPSVGSSRQAEPEIDAGPGTEGGESGIESGLPEVEGVAPEIEGGVPETEGGPEVGRALSEPPECEGGMPEIGSALWPSAGAAKKAIATEPSVRDAHTGVDTSASMG